MTSPDPDPVSGTAGAPVPPPPPATPDAAAEPTSTGPTPYGQPVSGGADAAAQDATGAGSSAGSPGAYGAPPAGPSAAGPAAYAAPPAGPSAAGSGAYAAPPPPGQTPPPGAVPPLGEMPPGAPPPWSSNAPWPERRETQSSGLVFGIMLVAVGTVFLGLRLGNIALGPDSWPLWLIIPGLAMFVGSLFIPSRGGLGLAIPGVILAIVGGILWVQSAYGVYGTWAYAWALVAPTGPGLAMLVYGAVHGDGDLARDGLRATLTGAGLFLGFGLFFEGVIGISGHRIEHLDQVLPYAAIGLGILLIVLAIVDGGRRDQWRDQLRAQRRAEKEQRRAQRRAEKAARRAAR